MYNFLNKESEIRVVHCTLRGLFIWVTSPYEVGVIDLLNSYAGMAVLYSASGLLFLPGKSCDTRYGDINLTKE